MWKEGHAIRDEGFIKPTQAQFIILKKGIEIPTNKKRAVDEVIKEC